MTTQRQAPKPRSPLRWSYTWEALGHISTLRLFLFCPEVNPSVRCHDIKADLRPDRSLLIISWNEGAERMEKGVLKVPVPKVLIDFESPVDVSAREDHIEVRLVLVLPVDHPIVLDFRAAVKANEDGTDTEARDGELLLSPDSDLRSLAAGHVHLYCRVCSAKLTRRSLRDFVELPSVDWKEVADNWFGTCCCSFGGISEKLSNKYINKLSLTEGTGLLDPASVIICKDDLEGHTFFNDKRYSEFDIDHADSGHSKKIVQELVTPALGDMGNNDVTAGIAKSSGCVSCENESLPKPLDNSAIQMCLPTCNSSSVGVRSSQLTNDISVSRLSLLEICDGTDSTLKDNSNQYSSSDYSCCQSELESLAESYCCISGKPLHNGRAENKTSSAKMLMSETSPRLLHISSLASSFMTRPWNRAKGIRWVEFLCRNCSSLLGSYPTLECDNSPVDHGIRLFKFCISTCPGMSKKDVFRIYSLQKVFMNALMESASDELTFRTIVRDLNSNSPMLRLVLVNSKVWCMSGSCLENDAVDPISEMDLQPFAKLLYSDHTTEASSNKRTLEEWCASQHADEVYMLSSQIEKLIEGLKSSHAKLPVSCSQLQGMSVSFVER